MGEAALVTETTDGSARGFATGELEGTGIRHFGDLCLDLLGLLLLLFSIIILLSLILFYLFGYCWFSAYNFGGVPTMQAIEWVREIYVLYFLLSQYGQRTDSLFVFFLLD